MRTDADLYRRGIATLLASWKEYARAAAGAAVMRLPGVAAAVFPEGPEREVYNNAVLERGLAPAPLEDAVGVMEAVYSAAGIDRFAAWIHETEAALLHDARDRGCETASLQSTPMAERVYAAVGFRDLGRILEYAPPG
jgi:hypothetical protein